MAKIYQLKRMAIILTRLRNGRSARPDELVEYVSREMELFDDKHSDVSLRTLQSIADLRSGLTFQLCFMLSATATR